MDLIRLFDVKEMYTLIEGIFINSSSVRTLGLLIAQNKIKSRMIDNSQIKSICILHIFFFFLKQLKYL